MYIYVYIYMYIHMYICFVCVYVQHCIFRFISSMSSICLSLHTIQLWYTILLEPPGGRAAKATGR